MIKIKNKLKAIIEIIIIAIILTFGYQCLAGMVSDNYEIWLDTLGAVGGRSSTSNYTIDTSFSGQTGSITESSGFREKVSFSPIEAEPSVGFNVQSVTLNFGELSPSSTAYSSHTFSAYTNSKDGYNIRVYGQPLHNSYHTISAIGEIAQYSQVGSEQFGINLVSNSLPMVGADPNGGNGHAVDNYNISNKYAYQEGAIIAHSLSFSYQTDFTVSVIVNISEETPAGSYSMILTYEFIPVF